MTPDTTPAPSVPEIQQLADDLGATIDDAGALPDGSGFAVMSTPLPSDHWLTAKHEKYDAPPMPLRMGEGPARDKMAHAVRAAARYAVRGATRNGQEDDFDPDALVQNMVVGLLGYWTDDGTSKCDPWANPDPVPPLYADHLAAMEAARPPNESEATDDNQTSTPLNCMPRAEIEVTPAMLRAGLPWLAHWQHKNAATRKSDLTEAYQAMQRARWSNT